ncbi:MAG: anti-sigma factor family protein [Endomicrobiales bacterium]
MECAKVFRKLSSYIDNELRADENQVISEHIHHCEKCSAELKLLKREEAYLRQSRSVQLSIDFRARFWERVRNEEATAAKRRTFGDVLIQRWIPVPVACSILIVLFSAVTTLSPLLYALPNDTKGKAAQLAANTFTGVSGKSVFSPMNFVEFCNGCHAMLCTSCREGEPCPMMEDKDGGCSMMEGEGEHV